MRSLSKMSVVWIALVMLIINACSLNDLVDVGNPEQGSELNESYVKSLEGGLGLVYTAYGNLQSAISSMSLDVGLVTDELTVRPISDLYHMNTLVYRDGRFDIVNALGQVEFESAAYRDLHRARIQASQGRDILAQYAEDSLNRYKGLSFAIEGFSVLMLAENFCSGIPLSKAQFGKDIEYSSGLSTTELFKAAGHILDTASTLLEGHDSYLSMARIGRMRAYMGEGLVDSAYAVSQSVDPQYAYEIPYTRVSPPGNNVIPALFWTDTLGTNGVFMPRAVEIVNGEGNVGRQWFSRSPAAIDPRVPVSYTESGGDIIIPAIARPLKLIGGTAPFPLARGVEALLVEAEYKLKNGSADWINSINRARNMIGMADTSAPASFDASVDLLFGERAAWLYLEGRRLGDLRRMVRQFSTSPYSIYPGGSYNRGPVAIAVYGSAFVFTPDSQEYENNHKYSGCENRNP